MHQDFIPSTLSTMLCNLDCMALFCNLRLQIYEAFPNATCYIHNWHPSQPVLEEESRDTAVAEAFTALNLVETAGRDSIHQPEFRARFTSWSTNKPSTLEPDLQNFPPL